ncbi:transposase [Oceanobacter sp. wDCs-4]|uniref:Transposase n=2 Tax=Oceanobacter antarcticus TaxID=3133425 RepID=A0ABW8NDJ3_9GAMM
MNLSTGLSSGLCSARSACLVHPTRAVLVQTLSRHIHRKKPRGKDMPERSKQANQKRSQVRARVEHVYADMKRDGKKFMVRCISQARAELRIGLMNMVYNARRWSFLSHVG